MVNNIPSLLAVALLSIVNISYADVCQYNFGTVRCGPGTIANLNANGAAFLNGTTITNQLMVNGTLTATDAHINHLQSDGNATINKVIISGTSTVNGLLTATNSFFSQPLTLNSNNSLLNASTSADITINVSKGKTPTRICLEYNTRTGSIIFNGGAGVVYESGGSTAKQVINGSIVQASCKGIAS